MSRNRFVVPVIVAMAAFGAACDGQSPTLPTLPDFQPPANVGATNPVATLPSALAASCTVSTKEGTVPLVVEFVAYPSGGGAPYEFLWSFGDGTTSAARRASNTYLTPGAYEVSVEVKSGSQTITCVKASKIVVHAVVVPPTPPPARLHMVQVMRSGSGMGIVTSTPEGIACSEDCQEPYAAGTVVTLTAAADKGSIFIGWSDCDEVAAKGALTITFKPINPVCEFTVTAPRTVTANFETFSTY